MPWHVVATGHLLAVLRLPAEMACPVTEQSVGLQPGGAGQGETGGEQRGIHSIEPRPATQHHPLQRVVLPVTGQSVGIKAGAKLSCLK